MESTEDAPPTALRRSPSWLIGQAAIYGQRLLNDRLADIDARRYHFSVLSALAEYGPLSQATLGRHCHLDRSDIAGVVAELSGRGLIDRQPDPTDGRRNIVTIAAEGQQHLEHLRDLVAGVQDDLLAPLPQDEREKLADLMTRVVEHHAALKGTGWA